MQLRKLNGRESMMGDLRERVKQKQVVDQEVLAHHEGDHCSMFYCRPTLDYFTFSLLLVRSLSSHPCWS